MSDPRSPDGALAVWSERALGPVLAAWLVVETLRAEDADQPAAAIAAAVGGLALLFRRRPALAAFVVGQAFLRSLELLMPASFLDDSPSYVVLFVVATYSLGRWSRGREHWGAPLAVALSTSSFVLSDVARSDTQMTPSLGSLIFALVFCAGPWGVGLAISALADRNHRLREEQDEVAQRAVIEERARIARELHDVVSHAISVTVLQARGARRSLDDDPVAAREALDAIEHTNAQALGDMRRLLAVLRDTEADTLTAPQPSLARVEDLAGDFRDAGLKVSVTVSGQVGEVPPGVDLSAYRIVQESLTNVLRHAPGACAAVEVRCGTDELAVEVTNTPPTARANQSGTGHGLLGVRERVAVVGGDLEAGPTSDGGYQVRARLPYALEVS